MADHPRIELSDSARWDLYRGDVDSRLLAVLAAAAKQHQIAIAAFASGHPKMVYATDRRSAHSAGFAADIYAVDGRPVVEQRHVGSAAYELARFFSGEGAAQLGSPWTFDGTGVSFTDPVHADHIHVQQAPLNGASGAPAEQAIIEEPTA